jgi:uncharacterized DUF497 family protein
VDIAVQGVFVDCLIKRQYNKEMEIEFDGDKRDITLRERGLDFAGAAEVFPRVAATKLDKRRDYGENRYITVGLLGERAVVLVWTPRGGKRRIISMRYANDRERQKYSKQLDRSGRRAGT